ncbi:hypothetical protein K493DRAFT_369358 [Basidiobolus meristosporus CBS 931.73]|uniref:Knr4/Smi1-like domain-containing protein n=1 Tax=Basidiobolus meristosporus CBS 931.73 TaxID=1314790 RepID=A0A1Y1YIZ0_9FUNG|nr:hypothetical protein K493DRAFT_369358 [Basidiobolus meristosporus CBS 931.73]|eukprot:ORX97584.1 hypothetical protein K493DRAFT_369358 [Basidiobolus meristosporus CBS 931.73]
MAYSTLNCLLSLPHELSAYMLRFVDNLSLAFLIQAHPNFIIHARRAIVRREHLLTSLIVAEKDASNLLVLARATQKPSLQLGVPVCVVYEKTATMVSFERTSVIRRLYTPINLFYMLANIKERQRMAINSIIDDCRFQHCIRECDPYTSRPSTFMKHPNGAQRIASLPTMEEVIQLEQRLKISLPIDYVHFLLNHSHKLHHFLSFSRKARCAGVQLTELDLDFVKTNKSIQSMSLYQPSALLTDGQPRRFLGVIFSQDNEYMIYLDVTDPMHHSFGCIFSVQQERQQATIPTWKDHSFTDLMVRLAKVTNESEARSPSVSINTLLQGSATDCSVLKPVNYPGSLEQSAPLPYLI